ncbi:MAG TPA: VWA domain-containing protein [Gaiellaceae bacterium]|nr:VWA domain-containing protein [Gaiellaceae bacterium]
MAALAFLTPLASLFVLAAAVPLAALLLAQRRAEAVRRLLRLRGPGRRALVPVVLALVLLPSLVAVAAAQPVVVRQQQVRQRSDAEAFVVLDTSLSMRASARPGAPTRLQRAKRIALALERALPDVPFGIASMTDRTLPTLMPTVDQTLFARTMEQSVGIDRPPPSQPHQGRATTFEAIAPLVQSQFYSPGVRHKLLVVLTDGEAAPLSPVIGLTLQRQVQPFLVHVWAAGERVHRYGGKADPGYTTDPASGAALRNLASITDGRVFSEHDVSGLERAARSSVGEAAAHARVVSYARVPLAPWLVLAAGAPLAFLLWRRNL